MPDVLQPYDGAYTGPQIDEAIGRILTNEYIGRSAAIKEKSSEVEPCNLTSLTSKGIHYIEYYDHDFHEDSAKPYYPIYLFVSENENTGLISQRYQAYDGMWYTRYIDPSDPDSYAWTIDNDYYKTLADTIIEYSDIEAIPKFETIAEYQLALESGEVKDKMCIVEEDEADLDYDIVFPYVGENKNWWLMGQDLGIKAIMEVGIDYFTEDDKKDIVNRVLTSEKITTLINNVTSFSINADGDLVVKVNV